MSNSEISRRKFIGSIAATGVLAKTGLGGSQLPQVKIDRYALVSRHNPVLRKLDPLSPLSVGNGEFAFTCDITGLQTFPEEYANGMPLCTMSQWGWHTKPMPESLKGKELKLTEYETYGRQVGYMTTKTGQEELFDWLRENPHRLHLGQIGFQLLKSDGSEAKASDITNIEQKLDLWTGIIHSKFTFDGNLVIVRTAVHPNDDQIGLSIESDLLRLKRLSIRFGFPYGSQTMHAADWNSPDKHMSTVSMSSPKHVFIRRKLDKDEYGLGVRWNGSGKFVTERPHHFLLTSEGDTKFEIAIAFSPTFSATIPPPAGIFSACEVYWKNFWLTGAAIDLSESKDRRAKELERRVILSQYLTAIQCSGSRPPQETGLTSNSWYGKYHLEMHWWHAAQFALWNRFPLLDRSLDWYNNVLPSGKERARQQGYRGVRWPKMTDTTGRDSPSPVGALLIWQQPHPIFYAELAYLNRPTKATLDRFKNIVEETATWMADYAHYDKEKDRYVLGPPAIPAQENHPARETWNPTYELEYWHFGLKTAQKWRERLGISRNLTWDRVIAKLSKLPVGSPGNTIPKAKTTSSANGNTDTIMLAQQQNDAAKAAMTKAVAEPFDPATSVYWAHENAPQSFTERNHDHPSMLAALGILTGEKVDRETMRRTLKKVFEVWDWPSTWGWDYPMIAMTAARLGETKLAIDALMIDTPKNGYAANGHNYQRPNLPLYLPGNGGLLYAIALMAGGWKGSPKKNAPGFPDDGSWTVRAEGFDPKVLGEI
ncbi:MAG: glycoside hydrolase family 65 [Acidobacteria bacterium]|nr:glycoside hydrolase family 65 [Acidobacteriota bacterium]